MLAPPETLKLLAIQHVDCEPAAAYGDQARARGHAVDTVSIQRGEQLPAWSAYDGIIAMGGPMGACDDELEPWLAAERRWIAGAVEAGTPYWGVCLGAQVLAVALGARLHPGGAVEVGVATVRTCAAAQQDPVFRDAPPALPVLQWHSDTFDLPDGGTLLATAPGYRHQAFAYRRAYGLQFHVEADAKLVASWGELPAYASSLEDTAGSGALPRMLDDLARVEAGMLSVAQTLFGGWLDRVVAPAARARRAS